MKNTLCIIAGIGLALSLIAHLISLAGVYIGDKVPYVWGLHIGIFIVWLPAILELRKNPDLKQSGFGTMTNPLKFFKTIFKDTPKPVMIIVTVLFFYTMINFLLSMQAGEGGVPDILDGKFVIHNHGSIVREITEAEFNRMRANDIRGFSGHWMAFYGLAMGILWPKREIQE